VNYAMLPRYGFDVASSGDQAVVIDLTSGRPVTHALAPAQAEFERDELNIAAGRGTKALARALGAIEPGDDSE
jgi:hypothetical protein